MRDARCPCGGLSHPLRIIGSMRADTLSFSAAVRAVAGEARRMGLTVPAFRSPPGLTGADRTIRRRRGTLVVAIRIRDRTFADVVADVVEGVLVANSVPRGADLRIRRRLLAAVEPMARRAA